MNTIVCSDYSDLSIKSAKLIFEKITKSLEKGNTFVLGLATGQTPKGTYVELLELLNTRKDLDFSKLHTFNLDEYYAISRSDSNSYYAEMMEQLWKPLEAINGTFKPEINTNIPNCEVKDHTQECKNYEIKIKALGGIDLQILGIGVNGHIGFNEPGSEKNSRTRLVDLTSSTIEVNAQKFFDGDTTRVPKKALSMGLGTIMEAREIILLASGSSKKHTISELKNLKGFDIKNPASILLEHKNVTWILDYEVVN